MLVLPSLWRQTAHAQTVTDQGIRCTCRDGQTLEAGVVSYSEDSGREMITRVEADATGSGSLCRVLWLGSTEIRPVGTPYQFHLERTPVKERRLDGCDTAGQRFVRRTTNYEFVFDSNAVSLCELRATHDPGNTQSLGLNSRADSNSNLWNAIAQDGIIESTEGVRRVVQIDSTRALNRRSWILARKEIKAHYVGVIKDGSGVKRLVPIKKTRTVKAGQLGQIEAVGTNRVLVRFYDGSRVEKFGRTANPVRRWYERIGGPYQETKDDLYTPLRACVLEVSLDDIVEINDYLDQEHTDRT
jgi:hypothetical protein